jgi:hypothetical protein
VQISAAYRLMQVNLGLQWDVTAGDSDAFSILLPVRRRPGTLLNTSGTACYGNARWHRTLRSKAEGANSERDAKCLLARIEKVSDDQFEPADALG